MSKVTVLPEQTAEEVRESLKCKKNSEMKQFVVTYIKLDGTMGTRKVFARTVEEVTKYTPISNIISIHTGRTNVKLHFVNTALLDNLGYEG